jgi:hypothetical protein
VTPARLDPRIRRNRVLVYVSDAAVVVSVGYLAASQGQWAWGPFAAGLAVGVVGLIGNALVHRLAAAVLRPTADQLATTRAERRNRRTLEVVGVVCLSVSCSLLAGSLRTYWPDILVAVGLAVSFVGAVALVPTLKRRVNTQTPS